MFDKQLMELFDWFHSIGLALADLSANVIDYTLSIITVFVTGPLNPNTGMLSNNNIMDIIKSWITISTTLLLVFLVGYILYLLLIGKGSDMLNALKRTVFAYMTLQIYVLIIILIMGLASLLVSF